MKAFPVPFNEEARLLALRRLQVLDSVAEPMFDRAALLARTVMGTPAALVSLIDHDRQWFKARDGFDLPETPRSLSLCAYAIMTDAPLVITDTLADPRFSAHPVAASDAPVRFYAGAPIVLSNGFRVGSLCAFDYVPRHAPSREAVQALQELARMTAAALEARLQDGQDTGDTSPSPVEQARSEFMALVSHELRTPLNGIVGLAQLLSRRIQDPASRSLIDALIHSGETLRRIIEHILHFSDAATGDLALEEAEIETRELFERLLERIAPAAQLAGKTFRIADPLVPARLVADAVQLDVALNCLVGNAIVHGGAVIELGCGVAAKGEIEITVRDDGPNIPEKSRTALFAPFRIGDEVMRRTASGIGIGLPLSKRLVELHGGELTLRRHEEQTVATVRLPSFRNAENRTALGEI